MENILTVQVTAFNSATGSLLDSETYSNKGHSAETHNFSFAATCILELDTLSVSLNDFLISSPSFTDTCSKLLSQILLSLSNSISASNLADSSKNVSLNFIALDPTGASLSVFLLQTLFHRVLLSKQASSPTSNKYGQINTVLPLSLYVFPTPFRIPKLYRNLNLLPDPNPLKDSSGYSDDEFVAILKSSNSHQLINFAKQIIDELSLHRDYVELLSNSFIPNLQLASGLLDQLHVHAEALTVACLNLSEHVRIITETFEVYHSGVSTTFSKQFNLLISFPVDIHALSTILLPPAMSSHDNNPAVLSDFLPLERVKTWAESCRLNHEQLKQRTTNLAEAVSKIVDEAHNEEEECQNVISFDRSGISQLETVLQQYDHECQIWKSQFDQVLRIARTQVLALEEHSNSSILKPNTVAKLLHDLQTQNQSQKENDIPTVLSLSASIRALAQELHSRKLEMVTAIQKRLVRISGIQTHIAGVSKELEECKSEEKKLEVAFRQLAHVQRIPSAWGAAVVEVVRRKEYARVFLQKAKEMAEILARFRSQEEKRRENFTVEILKYLPEGLLVGLDSPPPLCEISVSNTTDRLPQLNRSDINDIERIVESLRHDIFSQSSSAIGGNGDGLAKLQATMMKMNNAPESVVLDFEKIVLRSGLVERVVKNDDITRQRSEFFGTVPMSPNVNRNSKVGGDQETLQAYERRIKSLEKLLQDIYEAEDGSTGVADMFALVKSCITIISPETSLENNSLPSIEMLIQITKSLKNLISNHQRRTVDSLQESINNVIELKKQNKELTETVESLKIISVQVDESTQNLQIENNKLQIQIANLENTLKDTENQSNFEKAELKNTIDSVHAENARLIQQLTELQLSNEILTSDKERIAERLLETQEELVTQAEENSKLLYICSESETTLELQSKQLASYQIHLTKIQNKFEASEREFGIRVATFESHISSLQSENAKINQDYKNLRDKDNLETMRLRRELEASSDEADTLKHEVRKSKLKLTEHIREIELLESQIAERCISHDPALQQEITDGQIRFEAKCHEVDLLKSELDETKQEVNEVRATMLKLIESSNGELISCREELKVRRQEAIDAEAKAKNQDEVLENLRNDISQVHEIIKSLESQNQVLSNENRMGLENFEKRYNKATEEHLDFALSLAKILNLRQDVGVDIFEQVRAELVKLADTLNQITSGITGDTLVKRVVMLDIKTEITECCAMFGYEGVNIGFEKLKEEIAKWICHCAEEKSTLEDKLKKAAFHTDDWRVVVRMLDEQMIAIRHEFQRVRNAVGLSLSINENSSNSVSSDFEFDSVSETSEIEIERFSSGLYDALEKVARYGTFISEGKEIVEEIMDLKKKKQNHIAFQDFKIDDLVLFLPTKNPEAYAAFNVESPHNFMSQTSFIRFQEKIEKRDWVLGRISQISEFVSVSSEISEKNPFDGRLDATLPELELLAEPWRTIFLTLLVPVIDPLGEATDATGMLIA
ncbi:hypothetical protein HK096_005741, partial [Nowakowskiella sp. JEL0078]